MSVLSSIVSQCECDCNWDYFVDFIQNCLLNLVFFKLLCLNKFKLYNTPQRWCKGHLPRQNINQFDSKLRTDIYPLGQRKEKQGQGKVVSTNGNYNTKLLHQSNKSKFKQFSTTDKLQEYEKLWNRNDRDTRENYIYKSVTTKHRRPFHSSKMLGTC